MKHATIALLLALASCSTAQNNPERGELAYSAVVGTTGGSAVTGLTLSREATCLLVENTQNVEVMVTRSTTDLKRVPAYSFRAIDFGTNGVALAPGTVLKAYATGATGTTGYVEIVTCSSTR